MSKAKIEAQTVVLTSPACHGASTSQCSHGDVDETLAWQDSLKWRDDYDFPILPDVEGAAQRISTAAPQYSDDQTASAASLLMSSGPTHFRQLTSSATLGGSAVPPDATREEERRRNKQKRKANVTCPSRCPGHQKAMLQLEALRQQYQALEKGNRRLAYRQRNLEYGLQVADTSEQLLRMLGGRIPRGPPATAAIPAACSELSFSALPHASLWDQGWVERVRQLTPQGFLLLRRQWLQQSSMLLPRVQALGPGSEPHTQLVTLHSKHISLVQNVMTLIPEVWMQTSQYDMDTLAPVQAPSSEWISNFFSEIFTQDAVEASQMTALDYRDTSRRLQAECALLMQRYRSFAGAPELGIDSPILGQGCTAQGHRQYTLDLRSSSGQPSAGAGSAQGVPGGLIKPQGGDAMLEIDHVAKLIQDNLGKQLMAMKQYICAMQHSKSIVDNVRAGLVMYPLALNALDFGRGLTAKVEQLD